MLWLRRSNLVKVALAVMLLFVRPMSAIAQEAPAGEPLYLEVFINGQPTGLIANFVLRPEQRLAITVTELRELRIKPDRLPVGSDGLVDLDRCSGLTYSYIQVQQAVRIEISDQGRIPLYRRYQASFRCEAHRHRYPGRGCKLHAVRNDSRKPGQLYRFTAAAIEFLGQLRRTSLQPVWHFLADRSCEQRDRGRHAKHQAGFRPGVTRTAIRLRPTALAMSSPAV